jgi:hypothetical protein
MQSRHASIGATMTWIVATIIILIVILIFIYASTVLAVRRNLFSIDSPDSVRRLRDIQTQQTLLALLETDLDGAKIESYVTNEDYNTLQIKLGALLNKIPGGKYNDLGTAVYYGNWVFTVYKDDKRALEVGDSTKDKTSPSIVYLSDKKILFDLEGKFIPTYNKAMPM